MSSKLVLVLNCGSSSLKFAIIDALTVKNSSPVWPSVSTCLKPASSGKWTAPNTKLPWVPALHTAKR